MTETSTPHVTGVPEPEKPPGRGGTRQPTVIVDNVHVRYRLFATGTRMKEQKKLLKRGPNLRRAVEVHAVQGVTFTAYEGDAIGVIGHNGSGKSTLLGAIAGLIVPSEGTIWAEGEPTLLGVNAALIPDLSGERNIVLGSLALGLSREEVRDRYDEIAEFAGIEKFLDLPMRTYSSGMQARLRFAIAATAEHRVLLVDEALAVGDAAFQRRSEERIRELRSKAGTVFLVSHSLAAIRDTCNRTLWIHGGELRMDGDTTEVVDAYEASVK